MNIGNKLDKRKILWYIAILMLVIGIIISIYFLITTINDGYWICGNGRINFTTTGQFGDFFGGVVGTFFALTGTLLLFLNFEEQTKQNKKGAFETKYYEMLRLHKENINELQVDGKKGREAIEFLIEILHEFYNEVERAVLQLSNIDNTDNYKYLSPQILIEIKDYLSDKTRRKLITHQLSYGYFFYGIQKYHISNDKSSTIFNINLFVNEIIIPNLLKVSEGSGLNGNTHYNAKLGHYFRHLYQIIKLVSNENLLDEKEKYEYIKIVRAQLSDYEQILLYYNSLSKMGEKWITPLHEKKIKKMCFIARFKLIKNIPYYFHYFGIKPENLFETEKKAWESSGQSFFETNLDI